MCFVNLMSAATTIPYELCREISPGRATILEATSRFLDLHHQYRPESSGRRLRGRWMQVHPIQLLGYRHKARLGADASRKTNTLSRGIASDSGHTLHHDLFCGSVIQFHCESTNYRCIENKLPWYHEQRVSKERKMHSIKDKCNST